MSTDTEMPDTDWTSCKMYRNEFTPTLCFALFSSFDVNIFMNK